MSVRIETKLSKLPPWMSRASGTSRSSGTGEAARKSLGEVPPVLAREEEYPELTGLLAHYGAVQKIRRKLRRLSGRDARIVLAKNTVGAADHRGVIYLGVAFLQKHGEHLDLLAAVMAHEWGHLISNIAKYGNVNHLTWDQIFAIRREEEGAADAFCGRMLSMMGYDTQPICDFLIHAKTGNPTVKYYAAPIRAAIIQNAFALHSKRKDMTQKLFPTRIYANPYVEQLIHEDE